MEKEVVIKSASKDNMISIAKGIGIILMVIGHSGCPTYMRNFIYMFHMPLFFIISGYCFKTYYLSDFKTFAKKRFLGLYVPFIKYCILFLILHNLFYKLGIYNDVFGKGVLGIYYDIETMITNFFRIFLLINCESIISPLWFVASLFLGYFIFYFAKRYIRNNLYCGIVLLIISLVLIPFTKSSLPIVFRSAFGALYLWGGEIIYRKFRYLNRIWIMLLSLVIVCVGSVFLPTEMPKVNYYTFLPYFICSLFGSVMLLIISDRVKRIKSCAIKVLEYIGNHTMTILVWHFLCFKIVSLIIIL